MTIEKYIYKSLQSADHIRVLILHPSQDLLAPLQCSIKEQDLGDVTVKYDCISYTWGFQTRTHTLRCIDGSNIEITANLHSALSNFGSKSRTRCLWADAVCINQVDSEEKSQQIPLIPRIYRNASHVLVWLGNEMEGAVETLHSISTPLFTPGQHQQRIQKVNDQSEETQESVRRFFQLPWFTRRWVVQEVVLNPDVMFYCGRLRISWPRLHLAIKHLPDSIWDSASRRQVHKSLQKLGELWRVWSYFDQASLFCELFDLLDSFHHLECQEDKDRIYALAGLADDVQMLTGSSTHTRVREKISITPQYSLSDNEVFLQIAFGRMKSDRIFTTLAYAGAYRPRNGSQSLSSWAPDFRYSKAWRIMTKEPTPKYQPTVELRSDGELTLKGKVFVPYIHSIEGKRNEWDSYVVAHVFPGPVGSEPQVMLQFLRGCLLWMHSIPTLVEVDRVSQKSWLCDALITAAANLPRVDYEVHDTHTPSFNSRLLETTPKTRFAPSTSKTDARYDSIKSIFESLFEEEVKDKYSDEQIACLFTIFKAFEGRCLFLSNVLTMSKNLGDEDRTAWFGYGVSLLGIGPGDLVAKDVIALFVGVEQPLFLRPKCGKYRVLGDGNFAVLIPFEDEIWQSNRRDMEIVLV